jgi:phosphate starvation-inducible PhoH-like protein
MPANDRVSTKIVVPGAHSMVSLLGSRDELLTVIEKALASDVHVRGNEITITGAPADNALEVRLFEELISLLERDQELTSDAVERSLAMLQTGGGDRPAAAPSGTSRTTRLIELLIVAAVLLGIGGGYGLWVTSEKR